MKKISLILILLFSISIIAQAQSFTTFKESQETVGKITTQRGPSSVNWFDGGEKYSYYQTNTETKKREIRSFQPSKKKDELIFDGEGLMIPGTETPFTYSSFQWSADSKFLLFNSTFGLRFKQAELVKKTVIPCPDAGSQSNIILLNKHFFCIVCS